MWHEMQLAVALWGGEAGIGSNAAGFAPVFSGAPWQVWQTWL
jgi:hypothetical protein